MCSNQLKFNEDKTEATLFSTLSLPSDCLPSSVTVGTHQNAFSGKVRNLGFILDSNLSMKQHVIKVCQTAYYELKRVSSIRSYVTEDATKKLVTSCVLSRLDYCNSLLTGIHNSVMQPMQKVQNAATRLILRAPRHQRCTPLLQQLHWLPISERIKYKTAFTCYYSITDSAPSHLSELLQLPFPLSPLFIRHTHTQTPTPQPQHSWLSLCLLFRSSHLGQSPPRCKTLYFSPLLKKTNSRHFYSLSILTEYYCPSPQQSV